MIATRKSLRWHRARLLAELPHGMFSRCGGISKPPFTGLNLSFSVGDRPEHVARNRRRIKCCLGVEHLVSVEQTHGDRIVFAEEIRRDTEYKDADALITRQRGIGLLIQQADCQAVLLHDPVRELVAAVHSGWKSSVLNILGKTVAMMQTRCGTHPADLRAVISPSLGPCCAEFIHWRQELPAAMHKHQVRENYFDFWTISRDQLLAAGMRAAHIETIGICTACNQDFFSYRRTMRKKGLPGITGRCGSVIAVPPAEDDL